MLELLVDWVRSLTIKGKKWHFVSHKLPKLQISRLVTASLNKFSCFVQLSTLVSYCAVPPHPRWRAPPAVSSHLHSTLLKAEAALFLPPPPFLHNKPRIALRIFILTVFSARWKKTAGKKGGRWKRHGDKWESWLPIVNDHLGATLYSIHFQLFMLIQYKMYCVFFFLNERGYSLKVAVFFFVFKLCSLCCQSLQEQQQQQQWQHKGLMKKKTSQERLAFVWWIQVLIKCVMNHVNMTKKVSHTGTTST